MMNHTKLHEAYMAAGLLITGTNGDGSPNFQYQHPDELNTPAAAAHFAGCREDEIAELEAIGDKKVAVPSGADERTIAKAAANETARVRLREFRKLQPAFRKAVAGQQVVARKILDDFKGA